MRFKLIVAFVNDDETNMVLKAARDSGAMGATIIGNARGEGINPVKTFLGLNLDSQRDVLLFLVEEHLCRNILEKICETAKFDDTPGTGIAFQIDVEDAVGVRHQIKKLTGILEDEL